MNKLEQFIADNKLSEVTGKIFDLQKNAGLYTRVLHNTLTGQAIFIKYFYKYSNFMITVNPSSNDATDGYYINQYNKDGFELEDFNTSIENFKSKPASLHRGAIEI